MTKRTSSPTTNQSKGCGGCRQVAAPYFKEINTMNGSITSTTETPSESTITDSRRQRNLLIATQDSGYFGCCPMCGKAGTCRHVWRSHWMCCDEHKICWFVGGNILSSWRELTAEEHEDNAHVLSGYQEVEPVTPPEPSQVLQLKADAHNCFAKALPTKNGGDRWPVYVHVLEGTSATLAASILCRMAEALQHYARSVHFDFPGPASDAIDFAASHLEAARNETVTASGELVEDTMAIFQCLIRDEEMDYVATALWHPTAIECIPTPNDAPAEPSQMENQSDTTDGRPDGVPADACAGVAPTPDDLDPFTGAPIADA
jgi:hypothetical protein